MMIFRSLQLKCIKYSSILHGQKRFLDLQEFQSKHLLNNFGIKTQKFKIVKNIDAISNIIDSFDKGTIDL